jgi:hypothetical protein
VASPRSRADIIHDLHNKRFAADSWIGIASGTKTEPIPAPPGMAIISSTGDPRADAQLAFACSIALFNCLLEWALVEITETRDNYTIKRRRRNTSKGAEKDRP